MTLFWLIVLLVVLYGCFDLSKELFRKSFDETVTLVAGLFAVGFLIADLYVFCLIIQEIIHD
ncbi:hypothetical protein [Sutterella sp.]|uniref:hypothetical protein n=1 Tax=Sutterella sp. TaxID=1981025 RepID=UPI0026DF882A|nr:hypothetical protein [Sutterella sp.]MDO5531049.1 hypothetical protein [Sutterella sp.]